MASRVKISPIGLLCALLVFFALVGCTKNTLTPVTQVDRVARPFLNEVFLSTQANSNTFNSIPPSSDLLGVSTSVSTERNSIWNYFHTYATGVGLVSGPTSTQLASGFVPDVLRIDTTLTTSTVGNWAYSRSTTLPGGEAILIGGRKIEDDVWDITASYILNGSLSGGPSTAVANGADRVCYEGASSTRCSGASSSLQGHDMLYGATAYNSSATFPFLATPN